MEKSAAIETSDPGGRQAAAQREARGLRVSASLAGFGLIVVYLAILVLPLAAAWSQGLPPRPWQYDLSSGLALCAFTGILLEFLLSGRFRFISGRIGIDATMRVHQLMARIFTLALLIHPFLYWGGASGDPLPWDTTRQLSLDFSPVASATGLIAWLALLYLVLTGIFREQRSGSYEAWRAAHGFAAVIVAGFGTLHTVQAGRYSADPLLFWFWIAMLTVALSTLVWVYLLKPALKARHRYRITAVRPIAERTWELGLAPAQGDTLSFRAGQFVWLSVGRSPFSLHENPFSIASAPTDRDGLSFVIKEVGDFTRGLNDIKPGTVAYIDGPHGNMTLDGLGDAGIALYAGGVGVAPILSILRELRDRGDRRPLLLLYGNRAAAQITYRDELTEMTQQLDLEVAYYLSEPPDGWEGRTGVIDRVAVAEALEARDVKNWLHVICGPLKMIEGVEAELLARGVPSAQILSERFYYD